MAVFESTAAELGSLARPRLPEISVISPGLDTRPSITEQVRGVGSMLLCAVSFHCKQIRFVYIHHLSPKCIVCILKT